MLCDPALRAKYDEYGKSGVANEEFMDPKAFFEMSTGNEAFDHLVGKLVREWVRSGFYARGVCCASEFPLFRTWFRNWAAMTHSIVIGHLICHILVCFYAGHHARQRARRRHLA